jgi:hypothetical protein
VERRKLWHFLFLIPDDVRGSSHFSSITFYSTWVKKSAFYAGWPGSLFVYQWYDDYLEVGHMLKKVGRHVRCIGWRESRTFFKVI